MPKKHSKADPRKRLNAEAKRYSISVAELKYRLKCDGDGDNRALPPEDSIIVSHDTHEDSLECPNPASNTSNASTIVTTYTTLCPVEEHLATAGAVTTVWQHLGLAGQEAEGEYSLFTVEEQLAHIFLLQDAVLRKEGDRENGVTTAGCLGVVSLQEEEQTTECQESRPPMKRT
jgi:hypothetical protein